MAGHYMDCAANTDLQASKKLVLMCIADDADKQSRIGRVGLDAIRTWSGLGRSRALEVIKQLVDEGYLVRHAAGRIGRQAEFVVFPAGCCPLHGPVPGYAPPAATVDDVEHTDDRGSGGPDPLSAAESREGPEEGPEEGPAQSGPPLELSIKKPPNPPASQGAKCDHGRTSGCRRCGTNPRAAQAAEQLAAAESAAAELDRIERARAQLPWCGDRSCDRHSRWREADNGQARCPLCHPDVAIGRPSPELVALAQQLPALRRHRRAS
jgi:hypothetical protein